MLQVANIHYCREEDWDCLSLGFSVMSSFSQTFEVSQASKFFGLYHSLSTAASVTGIFIDLVIGVGA